MRVHPRVSFVARRLVVLAAILVIGWATAAAWHGAGAGRELHVAPGGKGSGSVSAPYGSIQAALDAASPGDVIVVQPGSYDEALRTSTAGREGAPITIRGVSGAARPLLTTAGTVLRLRHPHYTVSQLVLDGQYGPGDVVIADDEAHHFVLQDLEIRRSSKDCVDLRGPRDGLIERALIHHCLNPTDGGKDAHGIVAGPVQRLTVRDTEIHTFSGDGFQVDPDRRPVDGGWDEVVLERCRIWMAPLEAESNGFAAGRVPGENAVDTKVNHKVERRPRLTLRNVKAWGFRDPSRRNVAVFNIKEKVDALIDGAEVWDSEVAFRLRGPTWRGGAWVRIQNSVIHDVSLVVRYEDDLEKLRIFNSTIGSNIQRVFRGAPAKSTLDLDARNVLLYGRKLPPELDKERSNMAVASNAFVRAPDHDYRLAPGSVAVDAGVNVPDLTTDRDGRVRPAGARLDVGAYEFCPPGASCGPPSR